MGVWWQYAAPLFPTREHHSAARVVQSAMREVLYRKWSEYAKRNEAADRIFRACMLWRNNVKRRRQIERCIRMHRAQLAYDSTMSTHRYSRSQCGRAVDMSHRRIKVPKSRRGTMPGDVLTVSPGSCVLAISCMEIERFIGKGNDLVMVVKPSKLTVQNLYHDMRVVISGDFTLSISGVQLVPDMFKKKLNAVGVLPGSRYRISVLR